jgi:hypothetical protein
MWWREPATKDIAWRGMLRTEGGGVGSGILLGPYPAFGVLGLLAAVLTHAAVSQGVQSAERKREQEEADKVLEPYKQPLQAWSAADLWAAARASVAVDAVGATSATGAASAAGAANTSPTPDAPALAPALHAWDGKAAPATGITADATPVFTLAQDHSALVLDAALKLVAAHGAPPVEVLVRVVSSPLLDKNGTALTGADAQTVWSEGDAQRLKEVAAGMLAHALFVGQLQLSMQLPGQPGAAAQGGGSAAKPRAATVAASVADSAAPAAPWPDIPTRTHRYLQGATERTERAQLLDSTCRRAVLRTLRGGLLSVPVQPPADGSCAGAARY